MSSNDTDILMRLAAFKRVEMLSKMHGHLTHRELSTGFIFRDERIPLVNPQRGIFKPRQMRYLLSIKTVIPKPGGRVWYDDQSEAHDQIYDGDDGIDYAFMGSDPNAADNQWLRAAYENQVGVIYFLGIAPGRYQPIWPVYIADRDAKDAQGPMDSPLCRTDCRFPGFVKQAAFDAYLIGIDPDYRVHVSDRLLDQRDGKMLEALKLLNGGTIPPSAPIQ